MLKNCTPAICRLSILAPGGNFLRFFAIFYAFSQFLSFFVIFHAFSQFFTLLRNFLRFFAVFSNYGATCPTVATEITSTNCSNHLSPFPPIQRKASDESDTSNKPSFVCDVCGKAFKRSRERQKHMLLHGMSTDLRCHDCQMDFTWEWTLNIHLQEKHGLPPRESNMTHDITPKSVRDRQAAKQVKERADAAAAVALHQLNLANQLAEANGGVKLEGLEDEYDIYEDDVAEENSVYDAGFEAAPVGNYSAFELDFFVVFRKKKICPKIGVFAPKSLNIFKTFTHPTQLKPTFPQLRTSTTPCTTQRKQRAPRQSSTFTAKKTSGQCYKRGSSRIPRRNLNNAAQQCLPTDCF